MVTEEDRQPPGTPNIPVSSFEELRAEIRRYRPVDLLARCRTLSLRISEERSGGPLEIAIPPAIDKFGRSRTIRLAPHVVSLIARLSLIEGSRLAPGTLDDLRFRRILRIVSELYEGKQSAATILLQAWDEQAWFQRDIHHAIGRGLMWYRDIPQSLSDPVIDLWDAFEDVMGMNVEDFFGCCFLAFTIARLGAPYQYYTTIRTGTLTKRAKELLESSVMKKFLDAVSTDQAGFRELALRRNPATGGVERYDFNPLVERPLIYMDGSGHIAPNPDLLIWMMDEQPYWRLREHYKGDGSDQPFGSFFGKRVFEHYVGQLLADRMPDSQRLSEEETSFNHGQQHGPDWLVIQGDVGIAIELVLATMPRSVPGGEEAILLETLSLKVAPRASNISEKIEGLIAGRPDLQLDRVRRWHRLVVTKTALPWISFVKPTYLDPLVDVASKPYHVLSIEDFEGLLAAEPSYGVAEILNEAERDPIGNADFRNLCSRLYRERGAPFYYGCLNDVSDEFLSQFLSNRS